MTFTSSHHFDFFQLLPRQKFIEQMSLQKKRWLSSSHSSRWLVLTAKNKRYKKKKGLKFPNVTFNTQKRYPDLVN